MTRPLQAIVFDFDGVIANSEPLHMRAFQDVLTEAGLTLTAHDYYARYLGYDDVGVFKAVARDQGRPQDDAETAELVVRKGARVQQMMSAGEVLFPGAVEFIRAAAEAVPIAIASGAQRHEIVEILDAMDLRGCFHAIVAAGDTAAGKPAPDPYRLAVEQLRPRVSGLSAGRCVAIEDSRWGLESARRAGLRCVGVTNSYPPSDLPGAELIVDGLHALTIEMLDRLVSATPETQAGA